MFFIVLIFHRALEFVVAVLPFNRTDDNFTSSVAVKSDPGVFGGVPANKVLIIFNVMTKQTIIGI